MKRPTLALTSNILFAVTSLMVTCLQYATADVCDPVNLMKDLVTYNNLMSFNARMNADTNWLGYLQNAVKETSKCYKKYKQNAVENQVGNANRKIDFILSNGQIAYKILYKHKKAVNPGKEPSIKFGSQIKYKINNAIDLLEKTNAKQKTILLVLNNADEMCNGLRQFYEDTQFMNNKGCDIKWKAPYPHSVPQWEKKLLNFDKSMILRVTIHIAGKNRNNKYLFAVIDFKKADRFDIMERIESISRPDFFHYHIAASTDQAKQRTIERVNKGHTNPNTVIVIEDVTKASAIFKFFRDSLQHDGDQYYLSPENSKTKVYHYARPTADADNNMKVDTIPPEFLQSQKFRIAIGDYYYNNAYYVRVIYHLEEHCEIHKINGQAGREHLFCQHLYPNDDKKVRCRGDTQRCGKNN